MRITSIFLTFFILYSIANAQPLPAKAPHPNPGKQPITTPNPGKQSITALTNFKTIRKKHLLYVD